MAGGCKVSPAFVGGPETWHLADKGWAKAKGTVAEDSKFTGTPCSSGPAPALPLELGVQSVP